jgi:hypothetical protein
MIKYETLAFSNHKTDGQAGPYENFPGHPVLPATRELGGDMMVKKFAAVVEYKLLRRLERRIDQIDSEMASFLKSTSGQGGTRPPPSKRLNKQL